MATAGDRTGLTRLPDPFDLEAVGPVAPGISGSRKATVFLQFVRAVRT